MTARIGVLCSWIVSLAATALAQEPLSDAVWIGKADADHDQFADCVASAGDVNGDGLDDIIIGSYNTIESSASVFLGSAAGPEIVAVWVDESNQADSRFGLSVASAGDVNGDGFDDVAVGAPYFDGGSVDEGKAYIHLGSTYGPEAGFAWRTEPEQASAHHGYVVASAGDVDADGFGDVLVAAPDFDNVPSGEGKASVYLGAAAGPAEVADQVLEGSQSSADFAWSVASAGDVNGDGYDDVVAGAPGYDDGAIDEGLVSLFLGSSGGVQADAAWTIGSSQPSSNFGFSIASAGDIDGDGFDDVLVGAPDYDGDSTDEGSAFLYRGSVSGLLSAADWTAEPSLEDAHFGTSVAATGDLNGDGYADVVVGAPDDSGVQVEEGVVYVYVGSAAALAAVPIWIGEGGLAGGDYGWTVASAGDVNGDGFGDLVVGAPSYEVGAAGTIGAAFVYLGGCYDQSSDADVDGVGDMCDQCVGDDASGDSDLDGFCALQVGGEVEDCDDSDAAVYPGAPVLCDGIDNECVGLSSDELDLDADGFRVCHGDCDDDDPLVFPGAMEQCDGANTSCADTFPADELDGDHDSFMVCEGDCDDVQPLAYPTMAELCSDSFDNNCDGRVDEGCATTDADAKEPPNKNGCSTTGYAGLGLPLAALALLVRRRSARPSSRTPPRHATRGLPSVVARDVPCTEQLLSRSRIRVVLGDRVTVAVSPYDLMKGRIVFRHKGSGVPVRERHR